MQHDVYANFGARTRLTRPFLVVLQSDFAEGPLRLVCPLIRQSGIRPTRSMPLLSFEADPFLLDAVEIFAIRTLSLRRPVGTVAAYRDTILAALDWLFTGI